MEELFDMALADNGRAILFRQVSPIHGYGLFTNENLPSETILCRRLGLRAMLSLRDERAIIGIDGVDPATPEDYLFKNINHSCHPNARLTDSGCLVNITKISGGSEITIDYSLLLEGSIWETTCLCGSPDCRGIIKSL